jgi:hypothetical protein
MVDTIKLSNDIREKIQHQVLYVIPVISILDQLPEVSVGDTGTILYSMLREAAVFPGGSCDTKHIR